MKVSKFNKLDLLQWHLSRLKLAHVIVCLKACSHMRVKSPCDTISIEDFSSPQIANGLDKYLLFSRLCKHRLSISMKVADMMETSVDLRSN
jgi:hypothetical protein